MMSKGNFEMYATRRAVVNLLKAFGANGLKRQARLAGRSSQKKNSSVKARFLRTNFPSRRVWFSNLNCALFSDRRPNLAGNSKVV